MHRIDGVHEAQGPWDTSSMMVMGKAANKPTRAMEVHDPCWLGSGGGRYDCISCCTSVMGPVVGAAVVGVPVVGVPVVGAAVVGAAVVGVPVVGAVVEAARQAWHHASRIRCVVKARSVMLGPFR